MRNRTTGWLTVAVVGVLLSVGVSKVNAPVAGAPLIEGEIWTRGEPSKPLQVNVPRLNNQAKYEQEQEVRVTEELVDNTNGLVKGYKIIFTHKYEQIIGEEENPNTKFNCEFSRRTKQGTCILTTYYKIVPPDPDCWGCTTNPFQLP